MATETESTKGNWASKSPQDFGSSSPCSSITMAGSLDQRTLSPDHEEKIACNPLVSRRFETISGGFEVSSYGRPRQSLTLPEAVSEEKPSNMSTNPYFEAARDRNTRSRNPPADDTLPEAISGPETVPFGTGSSVAADVQGVGDTPYEPQEFMKMPESRVETVTPLHLLGDQPDQIDCPFCLRRSETTVDKTASWWTHAWATICFAVTGVGLCVPYLRKWNTHVEHYCANCMRRVYRRTYGKKEPEVFGTPADKREISRYPAAEPRPPTRDRTDPVGAWSPAMAGVRSPATDGQAGSRAAGR